MMRELGRGNFLSLENLVVREIFSHPQSLVLFCVRGNIHLNNSNRSTEIGETLCNVTA